MFKTSTLLLFICLSIGIGVFMALQTSINTQLRQYVHSPIQASLISFFVGTCILFLIAFIQKPAFPTWYELGSIPWYWYLGGLLGVYCITMSLYSAPRLGFLAFTGLVIFGQILMSFLLDHFGWLNTSKIAFSWQRFIGACLIFTGVIFALQR